MIAPSSVQQVLPVSLKQLEAVADLVSGSTPKPKVTAAQSDLVTEVLKRLTVIRSEDYKGGTKHIVSCPLGSQPHDAAVYVFPGSPIGFNCLHTGCPGHGKNGKDLLTSLGLVHRTFILGPHGTIRPLLANAVTWLETDPVFTGVIAFDEFSSRTVIKRATPWPRSGTSGEWTDADDSAVAIHLQQKAGILVGSAIAHESVEFVARNNSFHPVRDFLTTAASSWDQIPRLNRWPIVYLGAKDTPFVRAAGAAWLISGCARIFEPGAQADYCLLLLGEQGLRKSTVIRRLAMRDEWFWDCGSRLDDRDAAEGLQGIWICELSELASVRRSEVEQVRSHLSRRTDRYRKAYGRRSETVARQCIFAASSNDFDYNVDPTGDRRKWPIECGTIDLEALERDRVMLWGEAATRYSNGEKWYLSPEMEAEAHLQQAKHYQSNVFDQPVEDFLRRPRPRLDDMGAVVEPYDSGPLRVTLHDCLVHGVGKDPEKLVPRDYQLAAACLKFHHWKMKQEKVAGTNRKLRFYYPPQQEIDELLNRKIGED